MGAIHDLMLMAVAVTPKPSSKTHLQPSTLAPDTQTPNPNPPTLKHKFSMGAICFEGGGLKGEGLELRVEG